MLCGQAFAPQLLEKCVSIVDLKSFAYMNLLLIFVAWEHLFSNSVQRSRALPASVDVAGTCPHQGTLMSPHQFIINICGMGTSPFF